MNLTLRGLCECGCMGFTTIAPHGVSRLGWIKGQPIRFILGHHSRVIRRQRVAVVSGYRHITRISGRQELLHRVRAERALGRPLPADAIVHHADGSTADDAPLVICEDRKYHRLLHRRMRVKGAGGDPNTDKICSKCRAVKATTEFYRAASTFDGLSHICAACAIAYQRERRLHA